jgi:hypothetical protein
MAHNWEIFFNKATRYLKIDTLKYSAYNHTKMDYTSKSLSELKAICRERKIKGFSGKSSEELV